MPGLDLRMNIFSCEELRQALEKYMNGKYGKIDKAFFQQIGQGIRSRKFLTAIDLFCIICWKQWSYVEALDRAFGSITDNSEERIRQTTESAFRFADKGEIEKAMITLTDYPTKLSGVAVRTASAILTFYNPIKYAVVDVRAWKALYNETLTTERPTSGEYAKYLNDIRRIAEKCGMATHEVDAALWVLGGGRP